MVMVSRFRSTLVLILSALMVLTSLSMAVARTAPDAAGQMVLCSGEGSVVVRVDEDGQPIGPAHYCPDCAMSALTGVEPASNLILLVAQGCSISLVITEVQVLTRSTHAAQPRGPPIGL